MNKIGTVSVKRGNRNHHMVAPKIKVRIALSWQEKCRACGGSRILETIGGISTCGICNATGKIERETPFFNT